MPTQKQKKISNYFDNDRLTITYCLHLLYIYVTTTLQALQQTPLKNLPPVGGGADTIYRHSKKVKPTQ